ncbi:S-layer homology domain-containing protein [Plectonema cf. radiosum LEGE 06105]|uniref:S-layer homology domain-containing protein n=1 Tax=Plectonema cf. radiosum LEGE 06105 TaxID=945769 RepID=A0A8J7JWT6_9CYAN|nr:S-layer homology domain-containing protein [Plectonema radiosum]MBE9215980.1 S-layer homology domain-containing protein [Plectonema cf. radiosum LEGE 06105]
MTNKSPIDPQSSSDNDLGFDDFIGILVAFLTIGTILFWSLSRKDSNWNFGNLFSQAPASDNVQSSTNDNLTKLLVPSPEPNNIPKSRQLVSETTPTQKNPVLLERETVDTVIPPLLVAPPATKLPPDLDQVVPGIQSSGNTSNKVDAQPKATNTPVAVSKPTATPIATVTPSFEAKATKLPPTIPPPIAFTDVPADFWANRFINELSSRKFIEGYPDFTYRPQQPVNRAEFASIIGKAFQTDVSNNQKVFKDIPENFWAEPAIKQAVGTQFMTGYPDNSFNPEQKIPRVQVIVSLVTGLNLKTPASPDQVLSVYKDADQIPQWAREKVAIATANNLVVNHPDPALFKPNQEATRAEVATMIHQALVKTGKLPSIKSKYVVGQQ